MRNKGSRVGTPKRRWRQWSEQEARKAVAELAASGESAAAFSRRTGVSLGRLSYWRQRLDGSSLALGETTDFVAVNLAGVATSRCLEIVAAGVVVRVRDDLDVGRVAHLLCANPGFRRPVRCLAELRRGATRVERRVRLERHDDPRAGGLRLPVRRL
ncbi:MAG: transposase [Polyangiaceae bacterium]|nr:transposase [Polyangiaceae bacterium]